MNKRIMSVVFFVGIMTVLYAEAPELKNVMPNSWRKVTRLTEAEHEAFVQENAAVLEEIKQEILERISGHIDEKMYEYFTVYSQKAGNDVFYRVLYTYNSTPDFLSSSIRFEQRLIYNNSCVMGAEYNSILATQYYYIGFYSSIDIIEGGEGAKSILQTSLRVTKDNYDATQWNPEAYRKDQLRGYTESTYYPMLEIDRMLQGKEYEIINITASDCLVDPNIPLRYSLQNAFDNDPATSYVENTEDDLIEIYFGIDYGDIKAIAIINGFAQNTVLYEANNRVKEVEDDKGYGDKYALKDAIQKFQILNPYGNSFIYVTDIFRGNKYNDTCIAELNVETIQGWLFGDPNER